MFLSPPLTAIFNLRVLTCAALFLLLSACTPTLNWRNVQLHTVNDSTLKAALPCKPDTATRKQQLGDIQVELSMVGCMVDETTFTLSSIPLNHPRDAAKVLTAWQAAAAVNVGAKPVALAAASVSGAGAWPTASRVTLMGATTQAHMLWFAKQTAAGLTLYQAALYGKRANNQSIDQSMDEAITTFFESLQLQ